MAAAASKLYEELRSSSPGVKVIFAPKSLQGGNYWLPELATEIAEATAFLLFIGRHGVGPWQEIEYHDAFDKRSGSPDFPLILVLQQGQAAPGLPFLRQLHWIVSADPTSGRTITRSRRLLNSRARISPNSYSAIRLPIVAWPL